MGEILGEEANRDQDYTKNTPRLKFWGKYFLQSNMANKYKRIFILNRSLLYAPNEEPNIRRGETTPQKSHYQCLSEWFCENVNIKKLVYI